MGARPARPERGAASSLPPGENLISSSSFSSCATMHCSGKRCDMKREGGKGCRAPSPEEQRELARPREKVGKKVLSVTPGRTERDSSGRNLAKSEQTVRRRG